MRFILLNVATLFFAHLASAQEPLLFARLSLVSSRSPSYATSVAGSTTKPDVPLLRGNELSAASWSMSPGVKTGSYPPLSFRNSTGVASPLIKVGPEDSQTPVQLQAAFGLRNFSFRVSSWRRLGSGPSFSAGTLSVIRSLNLLQTGANTGFGLALTMYRVGSRFEPVYHRRPVSIQLLFRIRFGGGAANLNGPVSGSTSL